MYHGWGAKQVRRLLPSYVEGRLAPEHSARVERHLAGCAACRKVRDSLHAAHVALAAATPAPMVAAPEALWNRVEARLPAGRVPAQRLSRLSWAALAFTVAIFVVTVTGDLIPGIRLHDEITDTRPYLSPSWKVSRLSGAPSVGNVVVTTIARLKEGESLVTGAGDKARVQVADIGQVDVAPHSRLRLVQTQAKQHRLALDRGQLSAHVLAPPRLFLVDTPSAVAVDLGCAYTLSVDDAGNTRLQVTTGSVALERAGQAITVPAGAICLTRKDAGTGTPFFAGAPSALKDGVQQFDFENGGDKTLSDILKWARKEDTLTLFYLLPRVSAKQRERVIHALIQRSPLPQGVTLAGIRSLDPVMLAFWKAQLEFYWYSVGGS